MILSTADGLCGPGGADVLQRRDGTTQLYFHALDLLPRPRTRAHRTGTRTIRSSGTASAPCTAPP